MQIELNHGDYETLLLALGIATGAMFTQHEQQFAYRIVELINTIGKNNPNFRPYAIPEEFQHG